MSLRIQHGRPDTGSHNDVPGVNVDAAAVVIAYAGTRTGDVQCRGPRHDARTVARCRPCNRHDQAGIVNELTIPVGGGPRDAGRIQRRDELKCRGCIERARSTQRPAGCARDHPQDIGRGEAHADK